MPAYSASVTFPLAGAQEPNMLDVKIVQEEYKHDIAVFSVSALAANRKLYRAGSPVVIQWSRGRAASTFYGYVHHVEPNSAPGSLAAKVWCRGASSTFDDGLQSTFYTRTVTSVASELARAVNFDCETVPHGRVFTIVATGGRMWDTLVEYAKEIGYSIYCSNTRLQLRPRTALVAQYANQAPVFFSGSAGARGTLFSFDPIAGAAQPGTVRAQTVFRGTNSRTGSRFQVAGGVSGPRLARDSYTPSGLRYSNEEVATPEEARWKLGAMAENERYYVTAKAQVEGDPQVTQTWPVLLAGVDPDYEGLWFVHRVSHIITDAEYLMDLELGKDGLGSNVAIPDLRARRVLVTRDNPQGRPKVVNPPTILVNGQWRAQWSVSSRAVQG